MSADYPSICLVYVSFILAPLTALIVGCQRSADAKSVACWTLGTIVPVLLLGRACLASGPAGYRVGGLGMLVLCSALIAAVLFGYRIATSRHAPTASGPQGKKVEPGPWDDELA